MAQTLLYETGSMGKKEIFTCPVTISHHAVLVQYHPSFFTSLPA
jgi:hypothetical protein